MYLWILRVQFVLIFQRLLTNMEQCALCQVDVNITITRVLILTHLMDYWQGW